jgi:hypothetical protein
MLCHDPRCIFVHIPKAAGQSIEQVFLDLSGLTWKTRGALLMRPNSDPKLGPPRLAHLKATEYVSCGHVTQEQFDSYFKFSFVRNPWDRTVSMYRYLGYDERCSFKTFVLEKLSDTLWIEKRWFVGPQHEFVSDASGNLLVDFIGKLESIQADFDVVCRRLGIAQRPVPHVNRSDSMSLIARWRRFIDVFSRVQKRRNDLGKYQNYYDAELVRVVGKLYAADVEAFKYQFQ